MAFLTLRNWNKRHRSFDHSGAHMWGWTNTFIDFPELDLAIAVFVNHWSLPNDTQGGRLRESKLMIDIVRSLIEREQQGGVKPPPDRSWAWNVSYVAGSMTVEYVNAVLDIKDCLSPATIDMIAQGAAPRVGDGDEVPLWGSAGSRAGLDDVVTAELTPIGIAAFMKSDRLQVLPEELPILHLELGSRGSLPAPNRG